MDSFGPPRSQTVKAMKVNPHHADNDTWMEIIVLKSLSKIMKVKTRSFYYSIKNKVLVWDEPPPDASRIIPADKSFELLRLLTQSGKIRGLCYHADNDVWVKLRVRGKFGAKAERMRPLFYSIKTCRARWDDPGCGSENGISTC